jgi:prepilin-type N-terminal cleavage/methylation domain-containing protein
MMRINKKGFTLIELLAVIIILGVLMLVAIPSVTSYINNSRKEAYIDTARNIAKGAINEVNSAELDMFDTGVTYYIPSSCIDLETGGDSPYGGKFAPAYIIVTYDNNSYNYYWMSRDENGIGVKSPISIKQLNSKQIEAGIKASDIEPTIGVDGRDTIIVFSDDCSSANAPTPATSIVPGEEGGGVVVYPEGKTKSTVVAGDEVKISEEKFYVVKHDGSDLVLISYYNLKVGDIYNNSKVKIGEYKSSDDGYGRQSSEAKGWGSTTTSSNGAVIFSSTNYWNNKVGTDYPGSYCTSSSGTNCADVFDSNSYIYQYVNNYKTYLKSLGVAVKTARLMTLEESNIFKGANQGAWKDTSYWLSSTSDPNDIWYVSTGGYSGSARYDHNYSCGIRPVIVI